MTSLRKECIQAARELEAAYVADKLAYIDLNRRSKDFWALQPTKSWPSTPDFAPWMRARERLLAAEKKVITLLRERCEQAKARRRQRQHMRLLACRPYLEQLPAETMPDDLPPSNFLTLDRFDPPKLAPFLQVQAAH
ncbi:hypothetical protein QTH91_14790 [Variovorax dokdonensis]|uniref:Uncharacterized protein n=1 Tax=Variovorax dokdonensis TaxID=344883 RepID=A0ABT7NCT0_9BURK|nr:hypothetical protein [Variovorax dokdonensis]MDM0045754.1 hypothetical protein [Variovorax dokdonensis]